MSINEYIKIPVCCLHLIKYSDNLVLDKSCGWCLQTFISWLSVTDCEFMDHY